MSELYSNNDWRTYKEREQFGLQHSDEQDVSVEGKKLYFPNGIPRDFVIQKGKPFDAVLLITEEDTSELMHHGVKGQKWGVKNGPPYPLKEDREKFTIKKGFALTRYSDREENEIKKGSYASYTNNDVYQYIVDLGTGQLGAKDVKEIYTMKLVAKEDIAIRSGKNTVQDVVNDINDPKVTECYELLKKEGYFVDFPDMNTRYKIWNKNDETRNARKTLGTAIHKYVYADRNSFSERYKKQGYSAIIDPEDFVWNYEQPVIITDEKKFEISDIKHRKNTFTKEDNQ